jgi:TonB family protein
VLLTFIGTTIVLGGGGVLIWLLQRDHSGNKNSDINTNIENVNLNLNSNLNTGGTNFNFNANFNAITNANANANKSPTPTPKPSPSPSATPDEFNTFPSNNRLPVNSMTTPTPTPRPSLTPSNRPVNGGVLNGRAVNLATPSYPQMARQMHASGQVMVEVAVDESGRVVAAKAVSGNPLLRSAAESAARQSRIIPTRINNENVRTTGLLVYNFRDN